MNIFRRTKTRTRETTLPITGYDLVAAINEQVNRRPESFKMETWITRERAWCGSSACVAGWAVQLNGGIPQFERGSHHTSTVKMPDGRTVEVPTEARRLLGEAYEPGLFGGGNRQAKDWLKQNAPKGGPVLVRAPKEPTPLMQVVNKEVEDGT